MMNAYWPTTRSEPISIKQYEQSLARGCTYALLGMTKIPAGAGPRRVLDPNGGRFRGQPGIGYGDSRT
ncbi:unnamed protein product [Prunus armeniaca]